MKPTDLLVAIRRMAAFALPVSAGGLVNMLSSFVAMMMVADLGRQELAAAALAVTTFITVMTVTTTIFYAIGILASHVQGQGQQPAAVGVIVRNGLILASLLALPAGLVLWRIDLVLKIFHQDPALIAIARNYFHFAALNMFPLLINTVMAQFYAASGRPRVSLFFAILSLPLTLSLAYGLILGNFGLPRLGLAGVSAANFFAQVLMMGLILSVTARWQKNKIYQIFAPTWEVNWPMIKRIFTLGWPIGLQFGGEIAAMAAATYLMGHFGVLPLAASQIVSQYTMFAVMLSVGLTQALSLLVSAAYGKNDLTAIKNYLVAALSLFGLIFFFIGSAFVFMPQTLVKFYISAQFINADLEYLTSAFFKISTVLLLVDGMRNLLSGALRGLHDSQAPMRIGVLAMWLVSLPLSYVAAVILAGGPIGLRLGFLSGFILAAVLLWFRMQHKLQELAAGPNLN